MSNPNIPGPLRLYGLLCEAEAAPADSHLDPDNERADVHFLARLVAMLQTVIEEMSKENPDTAVCAPPPDEEEN